MVLAEVPQAVVVAVESAQSAAGEVVLAVQVAVAVQTSLRTGLGLAALVQVVVLPEQVAAEVLVLVAELVEQERYLPLA